MAKKIITIGKKGVTERIEGNGPVTDVNVDYPNGDASSNAGTVLTDRPQLPAITQQKRPFGGAFASCWTISPSGQIGFSGINAGDIVDFILFSQDIPSYASLHYSLGASSGLFLGANQIATPPNQGFPVTLPLSIGVGSGDSVITTITEAEGGRPGVFLTSSGVECYGYWVETETSGIPDFGWTDGNGGPAPSLEGSFQPVPAVHFISSGNNHGWITNITNPPRYTSVLVREDQLTQEMLNNPIFEANLGSGNPVTAAICGVYGIRS